MIIKQNYKVTVTFNKHIKFKKGVFITKKINVFELNTLNDELVFDDSVKSFKWEVITNVKEK